MHDNSGSRSVCSWGRVRAQIPVGGVSGLLADGLIAQHSGGSFKASFADIFNASRAQ